MRMASRGPVTGPCLESVASPLSSRLNILVLSINKTYGLGKRPNWEETEDLG